MTQNIKTVAIAGSTGFVGTAIRKQLAEIYRVIGLTRSVSKIKEHDTEDNVEWRHCDTHSQEDVTKALEGVDTLIYLIHSMVPSSRLTQANFQDLDILLADNFAHSAKVNGVKHILYISGLIPQNTELSKHLESRFEVEEALSTSGVPMTTLRCGLIIGPGGSSLRILLNLVKRLPVMGLPKWTDSLSQPIAIDDVLRAVQRCLSEPQTFYGSFDIGCPKAMNYRTMMKRTSELLKVKSLYFPLRGITPWISKRWVSTISGSSMELVGPLVDSLTHDMVVRDNPLQSELVQHAKTFDEAILSSVDEEGHLISNPRAAIRSTDDAYIRQKKRVRSVQRFILPKGKSAKWVLEEYFRWLPQFLNPFLRCEANQNHGEIDFFLTGLPWALLKLKRTVETDNSCCLTITGGCLANTTDSKEGRLEFRAVFDNRYVIASIHDFCPRLPWYIYNASQAIAHLWVMKAFGRHLEKVNAAVS